MLLLLLLLLTCLDPIGSSVCQYFRWRVSDWVMSQIPSVLKQTGSIGLFWEIWADFSFNRSWFSGSGSTLFFFFCQFGNRWSSHLTVRVSIVGENKDPPGPEPCTTPAGFDITLPNIVSLPVSINFKSFADGSSTYSAFIEWIYGAAQATNFYVLYHFLQNTTLLWSTALV